MASLQQNVSIRGGGGDGGGCDDGYDGGGSDDGYDGGGSDDGYDGGGCDDGYDGGGCDDGYDCGGSGDAGGASVGVGGCKYQHNNLQHQKKPS